ncbi:MAG: two-component system, cell cycle sensor histidine kinase and response regulator CckA, partial [Thermodesulfobacteriota bacterium]|nr:two-component system, cell cycle sensor histidine kinase and response regulator CckA [Thermodesulfobacteriota bacterium]
MSDIPIIIYLEHFKVIVYNSKEIFLFISLLTLPSGASGVNMKHRYLFGLLLGLVCSCLYLFYVTYSEVKEKTIADFNSRQLIHARQAARGIEEYFSDLIIFLTKLSESDHIIMLDEQGRKEMDLALRTGRQEMKAITRVDADGRILYTLPYDASVIGRDISYQKHVREIMRIRKPVVSDVFTAVQGYNAIALHVPVFKGNEYRGTLCFLIDFEAISRRFLQDIRIGETGYAWVTSSDGIELYCPVPGHTGKSVFENCRDFPSIIAMAKEMVKGRQGVTTYSFNQTRDRKTETIRKHAVYLPVETGNTFWSIVVSSSEDEILASLVSFRNRLIFVIGLLLLGGTFFSFYGMRALVIIREEAKRQKIEEALRESEEHYRSLFENNHAAMLIIDPDNAAVVDANAAACSYYGWSREDFRKLKIDEINTLTSEEVFAEMRSARTEKRNHFLFRHRRADGSVRDVEVYSGPLAFKGKVLLYSIMHDITERKQAEEALRKSEERYRDLVENATDLICTHDLKGTLLSVNASAARAVGFSPEEIKGLRIPDMLPPAGRRAFDDYIKTIRRDGTAAGTMKIMIKSGEVRYWEYRNTLRTDGVTEPVVRGVARDVTGEILARRALKESEKRYRLLFERNLAGVYRTTIDGRLIDCNDAFAGIYGYESRDEAIRHPVADFYIGPKAREEFIAALQTKGVLLDLEVRGRRKDGSMIWLLENASLVQDKDGRLTEIEGTLIDITGRKQMEEEQKHLHDRFLTVLDSIDATIYVADIDSYEILFMNKHMRDIFGGDFTGKTCWQVFRNESMPCSHCTNDRLRDESGNPTGVCIWEGQNPITGKWYNNCDRAIRWVDGRIVRLQIAMDITERKRTEEALRESEEKYRLTYSTSPDSVNINRMEDGLYVDINDGFTKLTGFTREEVIGKTSLEINIWNDSADRQKLVQGLRERGYYENLEARFRRKEGGIGIGLMSARVINLNGIPHIISITRDITEIRRLEEELLKAYKLESVGILAGGIAHDFNIMLSSVIGNISLAKTRVESGHKIFDLLCAAEEASMEARRLTGQLLTFARGGAPVKETASVANLIKESSLFTLR